MKCVHLGLLFQLAMYGLVLVCLLAVVLFKVIVWFERRGKRS